MLRIITIRTFWFALWHWPQKITLNRQLYLPRCLINNESAVTINFKVLLPGWDPSPESYMVTLFPRWLSATMGQSALSDINRRGRTSALGVLWGGGRGEWSISKRRISPHLAAASPPHDKTRPCHPASRFLTGCGISWKGTAYPGEFYPFSPLTPVREPELRYATNHLQVLMNFDEF